MRELFGSSVWVFALLSAGLAVGCNERDARQVERGTERAVVGVARLGQSVGRGVSNGVERVREESSRAPGPTRAYSEAVGDIAASRCEREQRCGNVGEGRRYESEASCRTTVQRSFASDLNTSSCSAGLDARELDECLSEIRNEDCRSPIDTIERLTACRTSDLCRDTPLSMR